MDIEKLGDIHRKKECDLCGHYAFERYISTTERDGGYTRIHNFEHSGFGTLVMIYYDINSVSETRREIKLCPECAKKIDDAMLTVIDSIVNGAQST